MINFSITAQHLTNRNDQKRIAMKKKTEQNLSIYFAPHDMKAKDSNTTILYYFTFDLLAGYVQEAG
jgi:hypothetical protein